jgi:hypothetical protein
MNNKKHPIGSNALDKNLIVELIFLIMVYLRIIGMKNNGIIGTIKAIGRVIF